MKKEIRINGQFYRKKEVNSYDLVHGYTVEYACAIPIRISEEVVPNDMVQIKQFVIPYDRNLDVFSLACSEIYIKEFDGKVGLYLK